MRAVLQDIRSSVRSLTRKPTFALTAVLMLVVGLGSAATVFTLLDALLLRPLDVHEPERLVRLVNSRVDVSSIPFSYPMWQALEENQRSLDSMFAGTFPALNVEWEGTPERIAGLMASGEMFHTLGVGPALGSVLSPEDDELSKRVVVLSHNFWKRRFGADPKVIGTQLRLEWRSFTIVGVAARGFTGLQPGVECDVILPLSLMPVLRERTDWHAGRLLWLEIHGRLKPGVSIDQARTELRTLWPGVLDASVPVGASAGREQRFRTHQIDVASAARGWSRFQHLFAEPLYILAAVVGVLLLIICVNLANLMLAHASSKRRETAIRLAMGAGRGRLFRQVGIESLLLAVCGAALGLGLSVWASRTLAALWRHGPGRLVLDLRVDLRLIGFLVLVTAIVALVAGLAPAVRTAWGSPATPLKEGAASVMGGRSRLGAWLLASQVAFSLSLLAGAGLLSRSLANLESQPVDFQLDRVLILSLYPVMGSYGERDVDAYYSRLLEDVRAIPGVESAAFASSYPTDIWAVPFSVKGAPDRTPADVTATGGCVSPGLFATLGTPLLAGRAFDSRDVAGAPKVAVLNQDLARDLFQKADPLGERIGWGLDAEVLDTEVVGVIRDHGYRGFRQTRTGAIYTPCTQPTFGGSPGYLTLIVRTAGAPLALLPAVHERIEALGVEIPVQVTTLREQADQTLVRERAVASLASVFGAIALVFAAFGLYALLSYAVRSQTREIGVRIALGADRGRLLRWVMLRALRPTLAGVAAGLPLAVLAGRYADNLLFGVSPTDFQTLGSAAALLIATSLSAAFFPARRAASIEPMSALREE